MQFWRYYTIAFPSKSLYLQKTAEINKSTKSVESDLTFIFIGLSQTVHNFVKIHLVLKIKKSFIKTCFSWKRGCMKTLFTRQKFVVHFLNLICTETRLCTSLIFIWKWIPSTFSFIWHETNGNNLVLEVQFFKRIHFLRSFLGRFLDDANILKYSNGVLQLYDTLFLLKIISLMGFNFF